MNERQLVNDVRFLNSEIRKLRARRGQAGGTTTTIPYTWPAADFLVDMFDRASDSTVGWSWAPTGTSNDPLITGNNASAVLTMVDNCVFPRHNLIPVFNNWLYEAPTVPIPSGHGVAYTEYGFTSFASMLSARSVHKTRLTRAAGVGLNVKITFSGPPNIVAHPTTLTDTASYAAPFGLFVGEPNAGLSVVGWTARKRNDTTFGSVGLGERNTFVGEVFRWELTKILLPAAYANVSGTPLSIPGQDTQVSLTSTTFGNSNTLSLNYDAGSTTITLNGSTLFSGILSELAGTPSVVGIATPMTNVLHFADYLGLPYSGVTSIKAWRADMSEPPSQSGRGVMNTDPATASTVPLLYSDFYHTPVYTEGVLTGYTYSPNGT